MEDESVVAMGTVKRVEAILDKVDGYLQQPSLPQP